MPRKDQKENEARKQIREKVKNILKNNEVREYLKNKKLLDKKFEDNKTIEDKLVDALSDDLTEQMVQNPNKLYNFLHNVSQDYNTLSHEMVHPHIYEVETVLGMDGHSTLFNPVLYGNGNLDSMKEIAKATKNDDLLPILPLLYEAVDTDRTRLKDGSSAADTKRMFKNYQSKYGDLEEMMPGLEKAGLKRDTAIDSERYADRAKRIAEKFQEKAIHFNLSGDTGIGNRWAQTLLLKKDLTDEERKQIVDDINAGNPEQLRKKYMEELRKVPFDRLTASDPDKALADFDDLFYYASIAMDAPLMADGMKSENGYSEKEITEYHKLAKNASNAGAYYKQLLALYANPILEFADLDKLNDATLRALMSGKGSTKTFKYQMVPLTQYVTYMDQMPESMRDVNDALKELNTLDSIRKEKPEQVKEELQEKSAPQGEHKEAQEEEPEEEIKPANQSAKQAEGKSAEQAEENPAEQEEADPADDQIADEAGMGENDNIFRAVMNYPAADAIGRMHNGDEDKLPTEQCGEVLSDVNDLFKNHLALIGTLRSEKKPLSFADWKKVSLSLGALENSYEPDMPLTEKQKELPAEERQKLTGIKNILRAERRILWKAGEKFSKEIHGGKAPQMTFALNIAKAKQELLDSQPKKGADDRAVEYKDSLAKKVRSLEREQMRSALAAADVDAWVYVQGAARMMDSIELNKRIPGVNWFDSTEFTNMEKKIFEVAKRRPETYQDMQTAATQIRNAAQKYLDAKHKHRTGEAISDDGKKREEYARAIVENMNVCLGEFIDAASSIKHQASHANTVQMEMAVKTHPHEHEHYLNYNKIFSIAETERTRQRKQLNASPENVKSYARYLVCKDIVDNERTAEASRLTQEELDRRVDAVVNSPAMKLMVEKNKRLCSDMAEYMKCNAACMKLEEERKRLYGMNIYKLEYVKDHEDPAVTARFKTGIAKIDQAVDAKGLPERVLNERVAALNKTYARYVIESGSTNLKALEDFADHAVPVTNTQEKKFRLMSAAIKVDAAESGVPESRVNTAMDTLRASGEFKKVQEAELDQAGVKSFISGGMIGKLEGMMKTARAKKEPVVNVKNPVLNNPVINGPVLVK